MSRSRSATKQKSSISVNPYMMILIVHYSSKRLNPISRNWSHCKFQQRQFCLKIKQRVLACAQLQRSIIVVRLKKAPCQTSSRASFDLQSTCASRSSLDLLPIKYSIYLRKSDLPWSYTTWCRICETVSLIKIDTQPANPTISTPKSRLGTLSSTYIFLCTIESVRSRKISWSWPSH